jgi:hypothetical protein
LEDLLPCPPHSRPKTGKTRSIPRPTTKNSLSFSARK